MRREIYMPGQKTPLSNKIGTMGEEKNPTYLQSSNEKVFYFTFRVN